jgi:hypothetical protein
LELSNKLIDTPVTTTTPPNITDSRKKPAQRMVQFTKKTPHIMFLSSDDKTSCNVEANVTTRAGAFVNETATRSPPIETPTSSTQIASVPVTEEEK